MTNAERLRYETYKARVEAVLFACIDANQLTHKACRDLGQLDPEFMAVARQQQHHLRDMIDFWRTEAEAVQMILDE